MFSIRKIAYFGLSIALILLFTFVPYIGNFSIAGIGVYLVPLIVMIDILIWVKILHFNRIFSGILGGLLLGLSSWIESFIYPNPLVILFQNPIFSVMPRVFAGLVAGLVLTFTRLKSILMMIFWSFIVVTSNTLFTLATINFLAERFSPGMNFLTKIGWIILLTNYLPELIVTTIIIIPVSRVIVKFY